MNIEIPMETCRKEGFPLVEKLMDISDYPVAYVLDLLLQDKSTKKNIIWAKDTYEEFGEGFTDKEQMDAIALLQRTDIIRPHIQKSLEAQAQRTRKKAEVFTPAWLCNRMSNHCDEDTGVFNTENDDYTWTITEGRIEFPKQLKKALLVYPNELVKRDTEEIQYNVPELFIDEGEE